MLDFIIGLLLLAIAAGLLIYARAVRANDANESSRTTLYGPRSRAWALIPGIPGILLVIASCVAIVAASVGVPVTLGKPGAPMQSGLHVKWPWTSVSNYPIRNSEPVSLGAPNIAVKTSQQGAMQVPVTLSYKIDPAKATQIWGIARSSDALRDSVVIPEARQAVVAAFSKLTNEEATATRVAELPALVRAQVDAALRARGIELVTLYVGAPLLDPSLQAFVDQKLAAIQNLERSKIDQERANVENATKVSQAEAQAKAARELAGSVTPTSLCQEWLRILAENPVAVGGAFTSPCGTLAGQVIVTKPAPATP